MLLLIKPLNGGFMPNKKQKTFVICSVRAQSTEQLIATELKYIKPLEEAGFDVHWPPRDTTQNDTAGGGYNICMENTRAISDADCVHIIFDSNSVGSAFDLGTAFALNKRLHILNKEDVKPTSGKSFQNVILNWEQYGPPTKFNS
jgi:nucleoside 2-deoxyribosyltransferase